MTIPQPHTLLDIQFSGPEQQKLRRLVDEICALQRTLNLLIAEVQALGTQETPGTAAHALVGPVHTAAGLTEGNVLKALSPTSYGFGKVRFEELFRVDAATFLNVQQGYVLTFHDGYYSMLSPAGSEEGDSIALE